MSAKKKRTQQEGDVKPGWLYAIRLLIIVAMGVSVYLAWISLSGGQAVGCGPDSGCDKVLHSRWAYWFGAPVSVFALITYSLILGASFRLSKGAHPVEQRKAWTWLVPCAIIVAGAALWFVGLQVFAVKAICLYCMAAHGSGFIAAVLLLAAAPLRNPPDKPWEIEKNVFVAPRVFKRVALLAVAALAVLVSGQLVHQPPTHVVQSIDAGTNAPVPPVSTTAEVKAEPKPEPPVASTPVKPARMFSIYSGRFTFNLDEVPLLGSPTNGQVIVSLFDYTCHHCRTMHSRLVGAQRMFSNSLSIVSLPMPLDPICNPAVLRASPKHTNACAYARLGLAVWRADRTRHHEFDDWLMEGDKPPPLPAAQQFASHLVGAAALDAAMQDPWVDQQIKLDVAVYDVAYKAGQGSMPQLILGTNVAVGTFGSEELTKLLVDNLGLKSGP